MKKFSILCFALSLSFAGCGEADAPKAVTDGISQSDYEKYNELLEQQGKEMESADAAMDTYKEPGQ